MKELTNFSNTTAKCFLTALLTCSLIACGSSSSDNTSSEPNSTAQSKGSLAVVMTDAVADGYSEVWVTFTSATLIDGQSDSGEALNDVEVSGETKTVNLLSMANTSQIFTNTSNIETGTYSKLRLELTEIQLIKKDAEGNVTETVRPTLVANGKLDILANDGIRIQEDQTTFLSLDFDAEKSIHTASNGSVNFRPVVFVEAASNTTIDTKPVQITGTIQATQDASGNPIVCESGESQVSASNCFTLHSNTQTQVHTEMGTSTGFSELNSGDEITLFGSISSTASVEGSSESFVSIEADMVQVGAPQLIFNAYGSVETGIDLMALVNLQLTLDISSGLSASGSTSVAVSSEATVYNENGDRVLLSDIEAGDDAQVFGVHSEGEFVVTAILIEQSGTMSIEGTINTTDQENMTFNMASAEGDVCVRTDSGTDIQKASAVGGVFTLNGVLFSEISSGQSIEIEATQSVDGCLDARSIIIIE